VYQKGALPSKSLRVTKDEIVRVTDVIAVHGLFLQKPRACIRVNIREIRVGESAMRNRPLIFVAVMCSSFAWGQSQTAPQNAAPANTTSQQSGNAQAMPGMDMSHDNMSQHDMSNMSMDSDKDSNNPAAAPVMHSMEGHMDMGPHMKMTDLRAAKPGDNERAQKVAEAARKACEKYIDYHVALADGFRIFLPNIPQKIYHFTNYSYGREAQSEFNPEHPTSLLYEKHGDDYKLVGVMYTAPRRFTEDELDQRIPLSVAQWHEHVNFCRAPLGHIMESFGPNPRFGFRGSISTKEACDAAGGTFIPVVLNWMVHVYPFEKDQAAMWSVERQHAD
jgi:hypothetical protein